MVKHLPKSQLIDEAEMRLAKMLKIIDNQKLELQYKEGFGAWTYHLRESLINVL